MSREGEKITELNEELVKELQLEADEGGPDLARVKRSVEAGADVNHEYEYADANYDHHHESVLTRAVRGFASVEIVKFLLEEGANGNLDHLLYTAARREVSHVEVMKFLIEQGADVNSVTMRSYTLLTFACEFKGLRVVSRLVEHGADVNKIDGKGDSPLYAAAMEDKPGVVEFLIDNEAKDHRALKVLRRNRNLKAIQSYLDKRKIDIKELWTEILKDAGCGFGKTDFATVKRLVAEGADTNHEDIERDVLIEEAVDLCSLEVVMFLLKEAAGRSDLNKLLLTATSREVPQPEVVQFLVEQGADVNYSCPDGGDNSLARAAENGCSKSVLLLLENGADVNKMGQNRWSPLWFAACHNRREVVMNLIEYGAKDPEALGEFGRHRHLEAIILHLDKWKININEEVICRGGRRRLVSFFRDNLVGLLHLLSRGAICPDLDINTDAQTEARLARDGQNVHTSAMNRILKAHVREARDTLREKEIVIDEHFDAKFLKNELEDTVKTLTSDEIQVVQGDVPRATGYSPTNIKNSIQSSINRFFVQLVAVPGGVVASGREAVALVFHRLLQVDGGGALLLLQFFNKYSKLQGKKVKNIKKCQNPKKKRGRRSSRNFIVIIASPP